MKFGSVIQFLCFLLVFLLSPLLILETSYAQDSSLKGEINREIAQEDDDEDLDDEDEDDEDDEDLADDEDDEEEEELADEESDEDSGDEEDIFAGESNESDDVIDDEDLSEDEELDELAEEVFIESGTQEIVEDEELEDEFVEDVFSEPEFDSFEDQQLEQRLYRIYVQFQSDPISDAEWEAEFGSLGQDIYRVQKGDTLWEISQIFFGDGFFWSKLWAVNGRITNPHLIDPGDQLKFVSGTEEVGPQLELTQTDGGQEDSISVDTDQSFEIAPDEPEVGAAEDSPEDLAQEVPETPMEPEVDKTVPPIQRSVKKDPVFLLPGAPKIPDPIIKRKKVLSQFPPSLIRRDELRKSEFDDLGFAVGERPALYKEPVITLANFITDSEIPSIGNVIENKYGNEVVSNYQYTYIKTNRPVQVGEKFSVVAKKELLRDADTVIGQIIEVQGEVTITDVMNQGEGLYRALVTNAVNMVRIGGELINEPLPRFTFDVKGTPKNIVSRIIGGQYGARRELFGIGAIVYLDRGAGQGLQVGDILAVSADRTKRLKKPLVLQSPDYNALLKIVKVYNDVATALVVRVFDDIRPGDYTGLTVLRKDLDQYIKPDESEASFEEETPDEFRLLEDPDEEDLEEDDEEDDDL